MKKIKLSKPILYTILLLTLVTGSVFAFMFKETEYKNNIFIPAIVNCEVVSPNGTNPSQIASIKVKNTGNINSYLRLKVVSYWVDNSQGTEEIVAKPSKTPVLNITQNWKKGSDDTYYYTKTITPQGLTDELLSSPIEIINEGNYKMVVELFAEAIQGKPDDAVTDSWGVTLDGEGNITNVK